MSNAAHLDPLRMAFYAEAEIDALRIRAVHELCVIGGALGRKVEFVERDLEPKQALRELHEAAFGKKPAGAPYPDLLDADVEMIRAAFWADDETGA